MKILKRTVLAFGLLTVLGFSSIHASSVGVLDMEKIFSESKVRQDVVEQIEERSKVYQKETAKEEAKLKEKADQLKAKEEILSKEVYQKEVEQYQREYDGAYRNLQEKQMKIQESAEIAQMKIQDKIILIAEEVAQEKKLDLVIPKYAVVYSNATLDITADIQKKLDAQLPKLKLEMNK